MLKHWATLLNTDCMVVLSKGIAIYPIFKNGSTSLFKDAESTLVNQQIKDIENILIFIRDPQQRFVKGVNEYCRINGLDPKEVHDLIKNGKLADRHFAPQFMWLVHLYRYYKGHVTMKPFSELQDYCSIHKNKNTHDDVHVDGIPEFIKPDLQLLDKLNTSIPLGQLVRGKNGLS